MTHASLLWAGIRRRPVQHLLSLACATLVFTMHGLMFGLVESFGKVATTEHATFERQLLMGAVILSSIGMALILLLTAIAIAHSVGLRKHEFGVLRALGFSHQRIIALVACEAAAPCMAGALLGLMTAPLLFVAFATHWPQLATMPQPVYSPTILASALVLALLVPSLGTVLPALRITRLNAAAALTGSADHAPPMPRAREAELSRQAPHESSPVGGQFIPDTDSALGLLRQILVVTRFGLSTLRQRIRGALLIFGGVALVVFVLLALLSMAEGIRAHILETGDPSGVVLRPASTAWLVNGRLPDGVGGVADHAPGVARAVDGSPLAEPVIHGFIGGLTKRSNGKTYGTTLVGVGPHWREMMPSFRLLSGRMPRPGSNELIVGHLAQRAFSNLEAGSTRYRDVEWRIVGSFSTGGWWDGYLVGDYATVKPHARDYEAVEPGAGSQADSTVMVRLESPQAFEAFRDAVVRQLPSTVSIERETDYYVSFWRSLPKNLLYVAFILSGLIAIGVTTGTAQLMNIALEERRREIAILRVLGFNGIAVAASATLEALLLALLGALVSTALVWLWLDGRVYAGAWSVFEYRANWHLLMVAFGWAGTIALLGTLPLAVRTARQGALDALQNLCEVGDSAPVVILAVADESLTRSSPVFDKPCFT